MPGNDGEGRLHDLHRAAVGSSQPGDGHWLFENASAQILPAADALVAVNALTQIAHQRKGVRVGEFPQNAHLQWGNVLCFVHHHLTDAQPGEAI